MTFFTGRPVTSVPALSNLTFFKSFIFINNGLFFILLASIFLTIIVFTFGFVFVFFSSVEFSSFFISILDSFSFELPATFCSTFCLGFSSSLESIDDVGDNSSSESTLNPFFFVTDSS